MGKRRTFTPQFKLQVVLDLLSARKSNAEVCREHGLAALVQDTQQRLRAAHPKRRGRPKRTVVTGYLVFDDSVQVKPRGRKMGGLGQHYAATEQRLVNGHGLFSGLYVLLGQRCPLAPRLYRQRKVCAQEGNPSTARSRWPSPRSNDSNLWRIRTPTCWWTVGITVNRCAAQRASGTGTSVVA